MARIKHNGELKQCSLTKNIFIKPVFSCQTTSHKPSTGENKVPVVEGLLSLIDESSFNKHVFGQRALF